MQHQHTTLTHDEFLTERIETAAEEEEDVRSRGKEPAKPFASPFWWGGYTVWGDGNVGGKHAENVAKKEGGGCLDFPTTRPMV